ncbi:hypothetical protein [Candidatus Poriferisodalis sp.]|uniref:hypothetical protein n=1 Tax=Candidatus Poriferisodalis sp. TaxID=3101277 RepID=UPI003B02E671
MTTRGQDGDGQSFPPLGQPNERGRNKSVVSRLADAMRSWGYTLLAVIFGAVGVVVAWETWLADEWFGDSSEQSVAPVATTTFTSTPETATSATSMEPEVTTTAAQTSVPGHTPVSAACLAALFQAGYAEGYKVGAGDHFVEVHAAVQDTLDAIEEEFSSAAITQAFDEGISTYERLGGRSRNAAVEAISVTLSAVIEATVDAELAQIGAERQAAEDWYESVDSVRAETREAFASECQSVTVPRLDAPIGSMSR